MKAGEVIHCELVTLFGRKAKPFLSLFIVLLRRSFACKQRSKIYLRFDNSGFRSGLKPSDCFRGIALDASSVAKKQTKIILRRSVSLFGASSPKFKRIFIIAAIKSGGSIGGGAKHPKRDATAAQ
jgi:hypothetical protein